MAAVVQTPQGNSFSINGAHIDVLRSFPHEVMPSGEQVRTPDGIWYDEKHKRAMNAVYELEAALEALSE